jgi:hypothetical protein
MAALPQQPLTFSDVFDDDDVEPKTVQHIRANSSIMQVNKILGKQFAIVLAFASNSSIY